VASQFTDQASQKSSVSIGSFDDLKLKEIFDTARKNKKDLETVQAQIDDLTQTSNAKVAALQQSGNSRADIASVNDATGAQAKAIQADTARKVAAEKASLAAALKPLKDQAADIQKKIDSYDDRIGQLNKKNQQVLDSQQRLFDLEKQKLTNDYEARLQSQVDATAVTVARLKKERDDLVTALKEKHADDIRKLILKYNPMISDPALVALLTASGTKPATYPALTLPDRIATANLLSADLQATLAARVDRTHQLLARLKQIPYENSVPPLINSLDNAIADSLSGYDGYLAPLATSLTNLDAVIAQRDATIASLQTDLQNSRDELAAEKADRQAKEAAEAAERDKAQRTLARWTGAVDSYVALLREDGVLADAGDTTDLVVVLKPDRAKALSDAIAAAAAAATAAEQAAANSTSAPPAAKKIQAPNVAQVRDGFNNSELGTVTLELGTEGWRGTLLKLNDPKRPFKAFDRLLLSLPKKK